MLPTANIYNLSQITEEDKLEAGTISTDLVRLADYGLAIPNSFIFTSSSSQKYLEEINIPDMWEKFVNTSRIDSPLDFKKFSASVGKKINDGNFSSDVNKQLERFYLSLSGFSDSYTQIKMAEIAVNRVEKARGFDYESFSNVKGIKEVTRAIKGILASVFSPEYLYYLMTKNISPIALNYPVLIQKMVQPEISGNLFTINSFDDNPEEIIIEAILGLYEPISNGDITPDHYVVQKKTKKILQKYIVPQEWMYIRKGNAEKSEEPNFKVNISKTWQHKQKLEDKYIMQLLKISETLEKAFNKKPIQVIWFYESGRIWIYSVSELPKLEITDTKEEVIHFNENSTLDEIKKRLGVSGDIKIFKSNENTKLAEVYSTEKEEVKMEEKVEVKKIDKKEEITKRKKEDISFKENGYELLLKGTSGVEGSVIGKAKIITKEEELTELGKSDVAVLESISPKYVSLLKNVGGIVMDEAGSINDVVLLAKDYGIPCIVGTTIATKIIKQGENIGMDATNGYIYEIKEKKQEVIKEEPKKVEIVKPEPVTQNIIYIEPKVRKQTVEVKTEPKKMIESEFEKTFIEDLTKKEITKVKEEVKIEEKKIEKEMKKDDKVKIQFPHIQTATKVLLSIQDPASITIEDVLYTDGVGLFRSEVLLTKYGNDLNEILTNKEIRKKLEGNIYESLNKVSESFNPKPVIYRLADFKENEVKDGKEDRNPMIGNRGAYSLLNNESLLEIELEAIRKVRNVDGLKNVWLNIPYARSANEVADLKRKILEYGFKRSSSFKIYVSIETPAMAMNIKEILNIGVDGIIIDTNDLIQLLTGAENSFNGYSTYEIQNTGIFTLIENIVEACTKENVPVIVTGNLISEGIDGERIRNLIESGVSGISINKDRMDEIKKTVSEIESKLLLSKRTPHKKVKLTLPRRKK